VIRGRRVVPRAGALAVLAVAAVIGAAFTGIALSASPPPKPPPTSGPPKPPAAQPPSTPKPPLPPKGGKPAPLHPRTVAHPLVELGPNAVDLSAECTDANKTVPPGDDNVYVHAPLTFSINFFGNTYDHAYVNNNGDLTFDSQYGVYTPGPLDSVGQPIIAPFFADVYTDGENFGTVYYGNTMFDGHDAFCATWVGVGYYIGNDKVNTFQVLLVDRSDRGPGEFDIVFNYDQVQWEAGSASGGSDGVCVSDGCVSAEAGYSAGVPASTFELPGSFQHGAFLDPNGLIAGSNGTEQLGRYIYTGPTAPAPPAIPQPLDPPDGTPVDTTSPTLDWTSVADATSYDVQYAPIGEGCDFSSPTTVTGITDTSTQLSGLQGGTTYCWRVQAENDSGPSGYSGPFTFTVNVPPTVTIDSTSPTTIGPNASSTVTWHADQNGSYQVALGGDDCSNATPIDGLSGDYTGSPDPVTTDVPGSDLSYGDNTVRVCLTNGGGTGGDSTDIKLLGIPTPLAPDNASTISGNVATIQWTSVGGETGYQLQYGTEGEGCQYGDPIDVPVSDNPSYTTPPLADGHYCWHVQAVDAGGVSGYDEDFEFYVAPAVPTPTSPPDTSTVDTSSPTLQWTDADPAAATYDVQWGTPGEGCSFAHTDSGLTATSDPLSGLADGTYCWHVRALDSLGKTRGYSSTFTFTVFTAPEVTVVSANPDTIGKGESSTITWHASKNGTFMVRVGGTGCSNGTLVVAGNYPGSPGNVTSSVAGSALSAGANTVRVCVTNTAGTGSDTTTVTLDATSPTFTHVPSDITLEATGPSGAVATYSSPSASDIDDAAGPVTCAPASGSTYPLGTSTVTCSSTDTHGNKGTAKFTVTVKDTTPPSLTVPADISVEATGADGAAVTFSASATDTVDSSPSVTCSPASGSTFPVGTTKVTCTATDASGNSTSKSFNVTVTPLPPPPPPPPPQTPAKGPQVNARPVLGKQEAKVKLPGSNKYVSLSEAKHLPPGTTVNVSGKAAIKLSDPKGHQMTFYGQPDGVPSVFVIQKTQAGVVQLQLVGGNFKACSRKGYRTLSGVSAKPKPKTKLKKPVRRLWGSGKGKFTTKGKYASATVRGTIWRVADYCNGTQVTVRRGLVSVKNFVTHKTKLVKAGHTYFAAKKP
jgi:Nidogen-like/HYR domain/Fibronectin type III domain